MKSEKGFTLVELIAVVIILGLIALIAIPYFTGSMKTFRDDFYDNLTRTVETAGKEFYKDNTKYLPSKNLYSSKVSINNLIKQKYINNSDDYEGNECDLDKSYVIVIKKDRTTYSYTACIMCPGDDFTTFTQTECDGSWADNTSGNISVDLGSLNDAYIYKGTSREEANEKLKTTADIVRKNFEGQVIGRVSGEDSGAQELYPVNIDVLDTNKIGTYNLTYEFQGSSKVRKVHVYDNNPPKIAINKKNTLKSGNVNDNTTVPDNGTYDDTNTDIWGQNLVFSFSRDPITEPGVEAHDYQWFVNGKWEPFCNTIGANGTCTTTVTQEMVEDVRFRYIDSNGNISRETRSYNIRIDHTKPSCTLSFVKPDGNNEWYVKDFNITATGFKDNATVSIYNRQVISGIRRHGVGVGGTTLTTTLNSDTKTQTADSKSFTWYGYVEDIAGNWNTCNSGALKKDKTKPTCSLKSEGHKGTNDWYDSGNPKISFSSYTDPTSEVETYGFDGVNGAHETYLTWDTGSATFTGYVRDKAGNVNNCTITIKRDTVNPTLSYTKTVVGDNGVTARINCSDETSGCIVKNETHDKLKTSTTYSLKDNAGHTTSITVPVTARSYEYEHCEHIHHYCERTYCDTWTARPGDPDHGDCHYTTEQFDCYEDDCRMYTGTSYE